MAQELVFTTTLRLRGPWLLETKQLLALDEILEQLCARDTGPREPGVGLPQGFKNEKSLTILLSNDRELESSSFKEAMNHIASQNEVARGFEYTATIGTSTASARLLFPKKSKKGDDEEEPFFEIKVSPRSNSSYEIFGELKNWAEGVETPVWRYWLLLQLRPLFGFGLFFAVLILLSMVLNPSPGPTEYKDALKQQARTLLRDGIS
jgi:hypothetical protein